MSNPRTRKGAPPVKRLAPPPLPVEETPAQISARRASLYRAADLVDGDRNAQYGDPIDDFRRTAIYWSTHVGGVLRRRIAQIRPDLLDQDTVDRILLEVDRVLDPHDVGIMMTQLKVSRLAWSPGKVDHYDDGSGYFACAIDCAVREGYIAPEEAGIR